MNLSIPETDKKRVVVIGGGFAGITFINNIDGNLYQTVLIDQNNYHQFQPLIYQVTSSGLEAASICFPFRRLFHKKNDFHFRLTKVLSVDSEKKTIKTALGSLSYDYLVICAGATTNFRGNKNIEKVGLPMKSVEESILIRNRMIENIEASLTASEENKESYYNFVVVGGGATGVEISGLLTEMRRYVLPKNFKTIDIEKIHIYLISSSILASMSEQASKCARRDLEKMGVEIIAGKRVVDYDEKTHSVIMDDGSTIKARILIWVSGVIAVTMDGVPETSIGKGGRIICNQYMEVEGMDSVFAAGDIAVTTEDAYPNGHPQMAQVAMQQAKLIAKNLNAVAKGKERNTFKYVNLGSMATIGRNKAVADIAGMHFSGFIAWGMWMVIHLRSILGVKNKIIVLFDWIINYFNYVGSLRLLIFKGKR
ncbi:MAG: NAD(P)/FAD-dependent oxidoreductase [Paludibacteraceae bacterium]|nr:NAD(P)/FAD-dependent oxidoreductase [Paludibacteraceae bacterium]